MVALPMLLQSCNDQEEPALAAKVQFTFSPAAADGGRIASNFTDVHALRLSLQKTNGEIVFTMKDIELIHFGDALITEPVELAGGVVYKITDFLLVDSDGDVLYATPQKVSPLGNYVTQGLPHYFTVAKNAVANVEMGVIDVAHRKPEDFGYASFNIREFLAFQLSAQIFQSGQFKLTDGKAYILDGTTTVATIPLGARVNNISFKGDASKTYTIKVVKDTYTTFTRDFVYDDLLQELDGKPLKAVLNATMTFTTSVFHYYMSIEGTTDLTVDWGDGTIQTGPGEFGSYEHDYADTVPHNVVITGALEQITYYYSYYGDGALDSLNVVHLVNLEEMRIGLGLGPAVIDLTNNPKIKHVDVTGLRELHQLLLPSDHHIRHLAISGPNGMSITHINELIDDIYEKAVLYNITEGRFEATDLWYQPTGPLGPPSPDRIAKLEDLRDNYLWSLAIE